MSDVLEHVPILVLEAHSRCNCRCTMCDIWKTTEAREISDVELERHLPDIKRLGVEWVVFSGGEPLMHSNLFRLARLLRSQGIRTTILSSGLLLERYPSEIIADIDDVIVSMDGPEPVHNAIRGIPGAFQRLAAGVRKIHQQAAQYSISARCTVQALNARHLRGTVEAARELGLRSISFLAADLSSSAFNRPVPWPAERRASVAPGLAELEKEIEALINAYSGDPFIAETPAKLRRIAGHFRAHYGLEAPVAPRCNAPWVSAVIEPNGDVRPCFFQPAIGNLANGTLAEVLNGPAALSFRESLNMASDEICRRCVCSLYRE